MTLRPRDRIAVIVVAALAAIAGFYLLALKPQHKHAASLDAQIAGAREQLSEAEATYAAGRAAQLRLKTGSLQWAALQRAVPAKSDIPALLRVLERNATAVGVKMTAITLTGSSSASGATSSGTTTGSAGSDTGTSSSATGATTIPLQLSFSGGYSELDRLVRRLDGLVVVRGNAVQASGPLLSISNVSLSPDQAHGSALTVQLTATIYQLGSGASTSDSSTSSTSIPTGGTS